MSRARFSAWNYFSGIGLTGLALISGFVATPIILRWLGQERLGAFRVATDWSGYLGLLELGLSGALLPVLARSIGRRDEQGVRVAMQAGFRVFRRVTVSMVVGGVILLGVLPWLVPVGLGTRADLRIGFGIGLLGLLLVPLLPLRALAESSQRGYVVNGLLGVQSVLTAALSVALAWVGGGITGQFLARVIGGAPFFGFLFLDTRRRHPGVLAAALSANDRASGVERELWQLSRPILAVNGCSQVALLTDNIVVSLFLGPSAVVPFFLTQRLSQVAQVQLQAVGGSAWAALAELHVTGQFGRFNRRLVELTRLVMVLGMAVSIPIVAFNRHFIGLWIGERQFGGELVTFLAGVNSILLSVFSLWTFAFGATGQIARIVRLSVAGAAVNLVVSVVGTWLFGIVGPLLGTTVASVTVFLWWEPLLLKRSFGVPVRELLGALFWPLVIGAPYAAVVWWIAHNNRPWGWLGLAVEMAATAGAFLLLIWFALLDRNDRQLWSARLRAALPGEARAAGATST